MTLLLSKAMQFKLIKKKSSKKNHLKTNSEEAEEEAW